MEKFNAIYLVKSDLLAFLFISTDCLIHAITFQSKTYRLIYNLLALNYTCSFVGFKPHMPIIHELPTWYKSTHFFFNYTRNLKPEPSRSKYLYSDQCIRLNFSIWLFSKFFHLNGLYSNKCIRFSLTKSWRAVFKR